MILDWVKGSQVGCQNCEPKKEKSGKLHLIKIKTFVARIRLLKGWKINFHTRGKYLNVYSY